VRLGGALAAILLRHGHSTKDGLNAEDLQPKEPVLASD
jgi:hypothetical protein